LDETNLDAADLDAADSGREVTALSIPGPRAEYTGGHRRESRAQCARASGQDNWEVTRGNDAAS
jgi:hypothetical protein